MPPAVNPPPPATSVSVSSFLSVNQELVEDAGDLAKEEAIDIVKDAVSDAVPGIAGSAIRAIPLNQAAAVLGAGKAASYATGEAFASDVFQNVLPSFLQSELPGSFFSETVPSFLGSAMVSSGTSVLLGSTDTASPSQSQIYGPNGNYEETAQTEQAAQQTAQQMEQQYQQNVNDLTPSQKMQLYAQSLNVAKTPQLKAIPQAPRPLPKSRPCLGPVSCGTQ